MANDPHSRKPAHHIAVAPSAKRVRVMFNGKTITDTLAAGLMRETGHMPVYYFPRSDVRMDLLERTNHKTHCPYKGDASYWTLRVGGRSAENVAWSYEEPLPEMTAIKGQIAFYWDKVDHWFEEDEEIFGHAADPHHRVDVRPSSREVRVVLAGETLALTRRALFLFETGLPTRYYIPREDVRMDLLAPSTTRSICPYKGEASYWSARLGERQVKDIAWAYLTPVPECPRIKDHLCFYPERVDELEVEGETPGR
jgi:uncharacterized protein (DUF427 family)